MADLPQVQKDRSIIEDSITGTDMTVNGDGSINTQQAIIAPPTSTPIDINIFSIVSSTVGIDTFFTITTSKTLTVQALSGGAEEHTSGSIIELFEDPNGDLTVLNRIETIFANGDSRQIPVIRDFAGDGTRRIVLRRRRYAANAKEMWGRWRGFEI